MLAIVAGALVCFVTGVLRLDVVALLVLLALSVTGLVTPSQAVSGFSNPAVVTIAGMFVISAALGRTGVASLLGRQIHRLAGASPQRLLAAMMLIAGLLSAFMNSVGLAAMMLPVVMDLARRSRMAPSKLLMPLVLGALLGGTTSLVGTAGNIVASDALREAGLAPFQVFDFTPIGLVILLSGVTFVATVGWRLLPTRDSLRGYGGARDEDLASSFELQERLFIVRVPPGSQLDGRPLAASRLGSAVGLHVVAILRPEGNILAPGAATQLRVHDRLLVEGRPELLREIQGNRHLRLLEEGRATERLSSAEIGHAEVRIPASSSLVSRTIASADLRKRTGVLVLALSQDGKPITHGLQNVTLRAGDSLLVQGRHSDLQALSSNPDVTDFTSLPIADALQRHGIGDQLFSLSVTEGSMLIGKTLAEIRLADAAGLTVVAIVRGESGALMPDATEQIREGDVLAVAANPDDLRVLRALQKLEIQEGSIPDLSQLESDKVGLLEVVLAPRTPLVGKTPRELQFREKYGLSVLALWRESRSMRSNLRDVPLRFGDSLLLFGPRARLRALAAEPDFIGLTQAVQTEPRSRLAPVAIAALAVALIPALLGWMDISQSVLMGATLAVVGGCLTIDEAYRGVELSAIVLIAAMLPLGLALKETLVADAIANGLLEAFGQLGPRGVLAALCVMTAIGSQAIPATALVVLMSPIAITAALSAGLSPQAVVMGVALSASSLSSPVGHPANALIMGPGGYRYIDYVKVGLPLTIMLLLIVIFVMPFFFPLTP